VTTVDIGALHVKQEPHISLHSVGLASLRQLHTGFERQTLRVGHSSGLVGFVVDQVALA
jgi:hypothetical protein